ncbi:MAG: hypothetical protein ACR2RV_19460, partial [Verrucomicrobiales bacterium]
LYSFDEIHFHEGLPSGDRVGGDKSSRHRPFFSYEVFGARVPLSCPWRRARPRYHCAGVPGEDA